MSKERGKNQYGRRGNNISLSPLTPAEAMRRLLNVKPSEFKAAEAAEKKVKSQSKEK